MTEHNVATHASLMWFDIGTSSTSDLFRAVATGAFADVTMVGVEPMAKDYAECGAWVRHHDLADRIKMLHGACAPVSFGSRVTFYVHRNNPKCSSLLPDAGTSSLAACCPHKNLSNCVSRHISRVQVPAFSLESLLMKHAPPPTRIELVKVHERKALKCVY